MKNTDNFSQFVVPGEEHVKFMQLEENWARKTLDAMSATAVNDMLEMSSDD